MGKQAGERMGGGAECILIAWLALLGQKFAERQRAGLLIKNQPSTGSTP